MALNGKGDGGGGSNQCRKDKLLGGSMLHPLITSVLGQGSASIS